MSKTGILYVGVSGFPFIKSATINKIELISKSLIENDFKVAILNRRWTEKDCLKPIYLNGNYNGIDYYSVFNRVHRPANFFLRNILKLLTPFVELIKIYSLVSKYNTNYIIVNSRNFAHLLSYLFIAKIKRQKLILTYVELGSSFSIRSLTRKINDYLFEKIAFKIIDGTLPISVYLKDFIKKSNPNLPLLKTPVLVDLEMFRNKQINENTKYFLFCGGAGFFQVIQFVINAFELVPNNYVYLHLHSFGSENELNKLATMIDCSVKKEQIKLTSNIEYSELIKLYENSLALLIPLRDNIQDKARFPHKIGEYAASGRPIISNNYGEMGFYFKDQESALLSNDFDCQSFADKMNFVINNLEIANKIGHESRKIAEKYFDYKTYGIKLKLFLETI